MKDTVSTCLILSLVFAGVLDCLAAPLADYALQREQALDLGKLTRAPNTFPGGGQKEEGSLKPLYFEGLPWKGKPTRVFAWLGVPKTHLGRLPGIVLVHGGGGTAYKEWVEKWTAQGFAAIAMGVEGQTDERLPDQSPDGHWKRHEWGGPPRAGAYADFAEPLGDQWMFHAVADTVLANSLLRSLPEVDSDRIGVCGISWGGIIVSTVIGIDARFAFGIPIYGCGALDRIPRAPGRSLPPVYREVWEPLLRLPRATMPLLWVNGPNDSNFSLEAHQLSYRAASGSRQVAVPFHMKHSHPDGWNPPDSYAFAKAIVEEGRPWAREVSQHRSEHTAAVEFELRRSIRAAMLVFKRNDTWEQTAAQWEAKEGRARASATIPEGSTSYYFNLDVDGLTLSSELQVVLPNKLQD